MIIDKLTVNNFRVFSGVHQIDLLPGNSNHKSLPVILFGGLNGAGKTSLLTAVRLAIFGKHAFERGLSKKEYQKTLIEHSHQSKQGLSGDDSFVEVSFKYVKQGEEVNYLVRRSWSSISGEEELLIYENGFALTELSYDQAQSFLFDLIPIGVADLFFFDGEKIKELAEEDDNEILADALKKMIGIDFIERGIADLSILLRSKKKNAANVVLQKEIVELESKLSILEDEVDRHQNEITQVLVELTSEKKALERIEFKLKEEGGDWVNSRDDLIKKQSELEYRKKQLSSDCQNVFKGNFPFTLAPSFMDKLSQEANVSIQASQSMAYNNKLKSKVTELRASLSGILKEEEIDNLISDLSETVTKSQLVHVTPIMSRKLEMQKESNVRDKNALKNILIEIETVELELDELGRNLARVPDHATLKIYFENLNQKQLQVSSAESKLELLKELCRTKVKDAIDIAKKLDKLSSKIKVDDKDRSLMGLANSSIKTLEDLIVDLVKIKVEEIQNYFYDSFKRMARKEDMNLTIEIEPETFKVDLKNDDGLYIDKKRLSAGEKQIYALAILEALGKASGRRLPFIIDTPLSRLDSEHRQKIVTEFFPKVNEQVIILSTDTEVDENFFKGLEPHIAKSYELKYDQVSGSTSVSNGYFWKGAK